ncbi:MAG: chemotaxis protein CheR, partial [Candidatus Muiribacterium halophilum]
MKKNKPLAYVGIGSSAGGLEVLKCFFENTPVKTGMAFIVIQHLAPNYKSLMDELLSKHTDMKINIAKEDMELLPDNIYLIPPNKNMTIKKGKLFPTNQDSSHKIPLPIDIFLKSLAEDQEEKSIAVILSGTGSDGSFGIRSIKESGGFVFIQDPETAKFDGMPKNSIKTGYYDYCMKVEDIPNKLLEITEHPLTSKELKTQSFIKQDSLEKILNNIKKYTGIDFRKYKENT